MAETYELPPLDVTVEDKRTAHFCKSGTFEAVFLERLNYRERQLRETGEALLASLKSQGELREALEKIIQMNRQHAQDQYGDPDKAESWSCVTVARAALAANPGKEQNDEPQSR